MTSIVASCWPAGTSRWLILLVVSAFVLGISPAAAKAQSSPAERLAEQALAEQPAPNAETQGPVAPPTVSLPLLELLFRGGWLMIPIGAISIITLAIGVERAIALRRRRVLPERLETALSDMAMRGTFDARRSQQLCREYPSTASRVLQAMLDRAGRPASEVEHAVADASQREADRLYSHVRTLHLATSVAPLLGLLGTVSGMIQAFFVTANMPLGSNKGEALAEGIYIALVTTFAGLSVAIPAAVLAHLFEARVLRLLRDTEELVRQFLPQVERLEAGGRLELRPRTPGDSIRPLAGPRPEAKAS